jgi:CheY-like chemotaxis protein
LANTISHKRSARTQKVEVTSAPNRILLAETHPTFVGVVRIILKETMGALIMVADEPSLIEAFAGAQFDLVIADQSFPVS